MAKDEDTNKPSLNQAAPDQPKRKTLKDSVVTVRMTEQLRSDLESIAERECRPLSRQICYFCIHGVNRYKDANPDFEPPIVQG
ncbi:MAG: hypothetical protein GY737_14525 [Desulfobacteraceae bacterium]|nr:hypothetical protein [Desulfobacteraceae bacterium]